MWLEIQIFGFRALWSPYFLTFVILLGIAYYLIIGPYRNKINGKEKNVETTPFKQQSLFYFGLFLLYVAKGSPVDLMSHIMLTAHMIQMVIMFFILPIFIISGTPKWLWRKLVYLPVIRPIFKLLTKPIVALVTFSVLFSLYHMPAIFDYSKTSIVAHTVILVILLFFAFIMWWPILTPLEEFDTLDPLLKMGYLVGSAAIITIACALIIFASTPLFSAYSSEGSWIQAMRLCVPNDVLDGLAFSISGPEMFSPLSVMEDQQAGGIIMKIMQEIIYIIMLARIFFLGFANESSTVDSLPVEVNKQN